MDKCLEDAIKAFGAALDKSEMEQVHEQLNNIKINDTDRSLAESLNEFKHAGADERMKSLISKKLVQIRNLEALADSLDRVKPFKDQGHWASVFKALKSKITGTPYRVKGARASTDNKINRTRLQVFTKFFRDLHDIKMDKLWTRESSQIHIIEAVQALNRGEKVEGPWGDLARMIGDHYEQLDAARTEMGIAVTKLYDRVGPNIHNQDKIMKLSFAERKFLRGKTEEEHYDYIYNRWKTDIMPKLDERRTFEARGIDVNNEEQLDEFMRKAFDNIVNKGKVGQAGTNLLTKNTQHRVFNWKDGQSMLDYNNQYGSGSIQDSILSELVNGNKDITLMKDWGSNPVETLSKAFDIASNDHQYYKSFNKKRQFKLLKRWLESFMTNDADYAGTMATINRGVKNFEVMTKLGSVVIKSLPDLNTLANECIRVGQNPLVPMAEAMGRFLPTVDKLGLGSSRANMAKVSDLIDTYRANEMGSLANAYLSTMDTGKMANYMLKFNLLHRWDYALRSATLSMLSRYFAQIQRTPWEGLGAHDRDIMQTYNIDKPHWEVIRQSQSKSVNGKNYITPENVQDVDDDVVKRVLEENGMTNVTQYKIQRFKDASENNLRDYFSDRMDHVVQRPDVVDRSWIAPTGSWAVIRPFMLFKGFGLSYARKVMAEKFFEKGARSAAEGLNPFSGKSNYMGQVGLAVGAAIFAYVAESVKNLSLGLSPPDPTKPKVILNSMVDALAIFRMAAINPMKLDESVTSALGPVYSDTKKLIRFGHAGISDLYNGVGFDNTKKAFYGLASHNIPLVNQAYTAGAWNYMFLDQWQDAADPGKRQKRLAQLYQEQGVQKLF